MPVKLRYTIIFRLLAISTLCVFNIKIQAQLLDNDLKQYSNQIVYFLKSGNELGDSTLVNSNSINEIFSRNIFVDGKLKIFEIGVVSSHAYKHLAIINGKRINFYECRDFLIELPEILSQIESASNKCISKKVIASLKEIDSIYMYNVSPPWRKKWR